MEDVNAQEELQKDYYDFMYDGSHYYRAFYNGKTIDKDCICGHVYADPGTRFIPVPWTLADNTKTYFVVPDDDRYRSQDYSKESTKQCPDYSICMVDSEDFYTYFVPGDCVDSKDNSNWQEKWEDIQYIIDNISSEYKDYLFDCFDEVYLKDYKVDHFTNISMHDDGSYDMSINRHNLWFANNEDVLYFKRVIDNFLSLVD